MGIGILHLDDVENIHNLPIAPTNSPLETIMQYVYIVLLITTQKRRKELLSVIFTCHE